MLYFLSANIQWLQLLLSNKALDCGQYILQYLPIVLDNELEYGEFFYNILLLPLPPNAKAQNNSTYTQAPQSGVGDASMCYRTYTVCNKRFFQQLNSILRKYNDFHQIRFHQSLYIQWSWSSWTLTQRQSDMQDDFTIL